MLVKPQVKEILSQLVRFLEQWLHIQRSQRGFLQQSVSPIMGTHGDGGGSGGGRRKRRSNSNSSNSSSSSSSSSCSSSGTTAAPVVVFAAVAVVFSTGSGFANW